MYEKLRYRWRQFYHAVQREGLIPAIRSAISYIVRNPGRAIGISASAYQTEQRIDLEDRWNLILDVLEPSHQSVLDIGCNEGTLTRRTAESDRFAIGIDQGEIVLEEARRQTSPDLPCYFLRYLVTPENVNKLPRFDVIYLFTVYYHWGRSFGWNAAEEMLRNVASNSEMLLFQTPESDEYIESERFHIDEEHPQVEQIEMYLEQVLPDSTVDYLGTTAYTGGGTKRCTL